MKRDGRRLYIEARLKRIRKLCSETQFDSALQELNALIQDNCIAPFLWNLRGDLIQLSNGERAGFKLKDAVESYKRALALNPNDQDALESLAHYYDGVEPHSAKAKRYAKQFVKAVQPALKNMQKILAE
jgi:tetratricopeptide (TPR) repeat protein